MLWLEQPRPEGERRRGDCLPTGHCRPIAELLSGFGESPAGQVTPLWDGLFDPVCRVPQVRGQGSRPDG